VVWNIKSQQERLVTIIPNDDWGGAGLLGVTIRLDNYAGADERLIRVLSVEPQSPAAVAGLVAEKDFLLGTTHQTLETTSTLSTLLQSHQDQVVEFYVYNTDSDVVRTVALMPTLSWGGRGLLGAEVGVGYLHRLPSKTRSTEGASVERKVRYVGVKNNPQSKHSSGTVLELEPQLEMEAAPEEGDDHLAAAPVLEDVKLTPMKPRPEETPVEPPAEMQPQEKAVEPQVEQQEDEPKPVEPEVKIEKQEESMPVTVNSELKEEPTKPVEMPEPVLQEAAPAAGESTANPVPQAAPPLPAAPPAHAAFAMPPPVSVFSRSPPQGPPRPIDASIPVSAAMLPPPPKMHYDSPPKASTSES